MPYMHKSTFEILQDSNIDNELDDYFEIDELIALLIQALNRKGYTTTYCCCGHSFPEFGEAFASPEMKDYDRFIGGTYATEKLPDGSHRILFRNRPEHHSYISFAEGIVLPSVPEEWQFEDGMLSRDYPDNLDEYTFFAVLVQSMKDLYKWAQSLPKA
jgi:hypothetical protein